MAFITLRFYPGFFSAAMSAYICDIYEILYYAPEDWIRLDTLNEPLFKGLNVKYVAKRGFLDVIHFSIPEDPDYDRLIIHPEKLSSFLQYLIKEYIKRSSKKATLPAKWDEFREPIKKSSRKRVKSKRMVKKRGRRG